MIQGQIDMINTVKALKEDKPYLLLAVCKVEGGVKEHDMYSDYVHFTDEQLEIINKIRELAQNLRDLI